MTECCNPLINGNEINAHLARFLSSDSDAVYREIFMLQSAIMDYVNSCMPCKSQCITVSNNTPFTYFPYINSVKVFAGGAGYYPIVAEVTIPSTNGTGAEVELIIEDGVIKRANVLNQGSGYSVMDQVVVTHPFGQGAILSASFSAGKVSGVTVINGGTNYIAAFPSVRLLDSGEGYGAIFSPQINLTDGAVEKIDVIEGGAFYSLDTQASVTLPSEAGASGAVIGLNINEPPLDNFDNTKYYRYIALDIDECNSKDHIGAVLTFFRSKGYKISVDINPKTQSTIQWTICWC
jgi:hypothetical protein